MAPDLVAPMVAFLAHEDCPVSGEIYAAGARPLRPHLHRLDRGYVHAAPRPTIEDVARHWATINDETGYYVPADLMLVGRVPGTPVLSTTPSCVVEVTGQCTAVRSRSSRFRTLPEGFLGSASMNTTSFGTLNFASWPRQCSISSSGVVVAPALNTTYATGTSPQRSSGRPTTAASTTDVVLVEHALDLGAGDVLTAGHDHVLEPVDDVEVAVVVLHADVAGVEPAAGERRARRVGIAPVALEHLRAAQHDLAAFTRGHRRAVLVPDVELEVLARPTDAAELGDGALPVEERVARHRLGEAVRVGEPRRRERPLRRRSMNGIGIFSPPAMITRTDERSRCSMPGTSRIARTIAGAAHTRGHPRPLDLVDDAARRRTRGG